METNVTNISVEKVKTSKISQVDFNNLPFGKVYSDHMLECDYVNGAWQAPKHNSLSRHNAWIRLPKYSITGNQFLKE